MEALIQEIAALSRTLSNGEKLSITARLSSYFGKTVGLSPEELAVLKRHELEIIRDTVSGLVLTRDTVPDLSQHILGNPEADYPRKVSFGHIAQNSIPKDNIRPDPADSSKGLLKRLGIRSIFFDVDDTLYSQFDLTCAALRVSLQLPEDFPFRDAYRRIGYYSEKLSAEGDLLQASPQGEQAVRMREERFILGLAEFGVQISSEQGAEIQQEYTRLQGEMQITEGAGELLASLNEMGMVVGIITNGNEEHQRSKLRTLGLSRYVPGERTFISSSVGFTKPDPRIFQLANVRTRTKARNSLYIGDSWAKDIAGASEAGWHAVWFNPLQAAPGEGNKPAAIVSTYAELRELLGLSAG